MYAIVEIAGQQYKVEKDQQVFVHRLEGDEGSKVELDNVLLIDNNGKINVGAPAINGAQVTAKIIEHMKGDKVIVFKKKRRKGYKVRNGHRQYLSIIQIEEILEKGAKKAAKKEEPKAEKKEATPKTEAKKAAPKKEEAKKEDKVEAKKADKPEGKTEAKSAKVEEKKGSVEKPSQEKAAEDKENKENKE